MLENEVRAALASVRTARAEHRAKLQVGETGFVTTVTDTVARVRGLPEIRSEELVLFEGGGAGLALNLDPDEIGVALLDRSPSLAAGSEVRRTHRVLDVPVGDALLGRVLDGLGRPLDERGPLRTSERRPTEHTAPPIMHRAPVEVPLQTGTKAIDALIPIGRGQRELIIGDRQTGKTTLAVDAIINQADKAVVCIYCAIGQRRTAIARVVEDLRRFGAMEHTIVVASGGEDPPAAQFITPYAATTMAEFFMGRGQDVLIVYDDLTRHARAYRELSLLLRRPPGREAYPGDIFYVHSRLLERSTRLKDEHGGGSLTALPIVETQAGNLAAFIPTNLISITDGQVTVTPELFHRGQLPAVDPGSSVSRVGGKAQLKAFQRMAGDLRLTYAQFEELEGFTRFGARLDEASRVLIERGRRLREVLKQAEHACMSAADQIVVLTALQAGVVRLRRDSPTCRSCRTDACSRPLQASMTSGWQEQLAVGRRSRTLNSSRSIIAIAKESSDRCTPLKI